MSLNELQRNSAPLYVRMHPPVGGTSNLEDMFIHTYISIRSTYVRTYVLHLRCVGEGRGDAEGGNEEVGGDGTLVGYECQLMVYIGLNVLVLHLFLQRVEGRMHHKPTSQSYRKESETNSQLSGTWNSRRSFNAVSPPSGMETTQWVA